MCRDKLGVDKLMAPALQTALDCHLQHRMSWACMIPTQLLQEGDKFQGLDLLPQPRFEALSMSFSLRTPKSSIKLVQVPGPVSYQFNPAGCCSAWPSPS